MPDSAKCEGGCGKPVVSDSACKSCSKLVHPGCIHRHRCTASTNSNEMLLPLIKQLQSSIDAISSKLNEQQLSIDAISVELKEQREEYAQLKLIVTDVKDLKDENMKLRQEVDELRNRMDKAESRDLPTAGTSDILLSTTRELMDRKDRECNVIIFDVPEAMSDERKEAAEEDVVSIRRLLDNIKLNLPIKRTLRLGKKSDKPRPIKITLDSPQDAKNILKNRSKVRNKIKCDETPLQQEHLKKIRAELKNRTEKGESDLTIKYVKGIPTIVHLQKNVKSSNRL